MVEGNMLAKLGGREQNDGLIEGGCGTIFTPFPLGSLNPMHLTLLSPLVRAQAEGLFWSP
jgi:hypothetical protein